MEVFKAIEARRAYRSLAKAEVDEKLVKDLAGHASLAPSCFNKQPWRFVFVYEPRTLEKLKGAMSSGNGWTNSASMIIAVLSREDYDCVIGDRKYYLFDTGMAVASMILRATELGFVAHPIAGFDPKMVREVLGVPSELEVVTLIIFGSHGSQDNPLLNEKQREVELERPPRKPFEEFACIDKYCDGIAEDDGD